MTNARRTSPRLHFSQFLCRRIRSSMVIAVTSLWRSYAMKFECGKQLRTGVWYICRVPQHLAEMPSVRRTSRMPAAVYRAVSPARRRGSKLRCPRATATTRPDVDLAAGLRAFPRALLRGVERPETFAEVVGAVHTW